MADKMWDILRFLKNPEGELTDTASAVAEKEKQSIDSQIISALEDTERSIDRALSQEEPETAEVSAAEDVTETVAPTVPEAQDLATEERGEEPGDQTATVDVQPTEETLELQPQPEEKPKTGRAGKIGKQPRTSTKNKMETEDSPDTAMISPEAITATALSEISAPPFEQESTASTSDEQLLKIPIAKIRPNPFQPRKVMGEDEIIELSESIRELGVLQPIIVKEHKDGYELIAGERRLRASQRAGLTEIPAIVFAVEPLTQQIMSLVENIQRKNLTAIEEAVSLEDILSKTGWSQTELSHRMGRSQASIANKLRLLRLDQSVQDLVVSGKLGERQARSLLSLSTEEQKELAQKAIDEDLSARALEQLAESWNGRTPSGKRANRKVQGPGSDGPAGDLLSDLAGMINKHRNHGISAQWKVREMTQSALVIEISVDLLESKNFANKAN